MHLAMGYIMAAQWERLRPMSLQLTDTIIKIYFGIFMITAPVPMEMQWFFACTFDWKCIRG